MNKEDVTRCYVKYIYLDVVQFSKRSAEAQSEIVRHLNEIVRQSIGNYKVNYDEDCILIPTGDGMCIALTSTDLPYDSHIQLAFTILEALDDYNKAMENETRRFQVRIGINQNTDILVTDINGRRNVAGAGVNMASRIMDKADGGQILVSQAVYHELQPSEEYMDKFKGYTASGKHNISFQVYQYIGGDHAGLNTDVPSAFAPRKAEKKKLSEEAAHYFAQAIMHKEDLLRIKATGKIYWGYAAVVLLRLLAKDSFALWNKSEFGDPPHSITMGAGTLSFEEQFSHYNSLGYEVLRYSHSHIVHGSSSEDGLELNEHRELFEYGDYTREFEFINSKGVEKLKEEWPDIFEKFALQKYA